MDAQTILTYVGYFVGGLVGAKAVGKIRPRKREDKREDYRPEDGTGAVAAEAGNLLRDLRQELLSERKARAECEERWLETEKRCNELERKLGEDQDTIRDLRLLILELENRIRALEGIGLEGAS